MSGERGRNAWKGRLTWRTIHKSALGRLDTERLELVSLLHWQDAEVRD